MNEKLSRPQFNQMDTTEKQTLMESLAGLQIPQEQK